MNIQGNQTGSPSAALSALSPGQKKLHVEDEALRDEREGRESPTALARARLLEKQNQKPEPEKPTVTYEDRLKQMISADEMRRLLYLYSPFSRVLLEEEKAQKGHRLDRTA